MTSVALMRTVTWAPLLQPQPFCRAPSDGRHDFLAANVEVFRERRVVLATREYGREPRATR
jgi:hypothetical protein